MDHQCDRGSEPCRNSFGRAESASLESCFCFIFVHRVVHFLFSVIFFLASIFPLQVLNDDFTKKAFEYTLDTPCSASQIGLVVGFVAVVLKVFSLQLILISFSPFEIYADPDVPNVTHFCLPELRPLLVYSVSHDRKTSHYKNVWHMSVQTCAFDHSIVCRPRRCLKISSRVARSPVTASSLSMKHTKMSAPLPPSPS